MGAQDLQRLAERMTPARATPTAFRGFAMKMRGIEERKEDIDPSQESLEIKREASQRLLKIEHGEDMKMKVEEVQQSTNIKTEEPKQTLKIEHYQSPKEEDSPVRLEHKPSLQPTKRAILSEDEWHPSKLSAGLKSIRFDARFEVRDRHFDLIVAAGASFCHQLERFRCGSAYTGNGSTLSRAAVFRLSQACPNLQTVYLDSTTQLTDDSLLAFLKHCPRLQILSICGNEKSLGKITGKQTYIAMRVNKRLGKDLKILELIDQRLDYKALRALSRARKGLAIDVGRRNFVQEVVYTSL